MIYCRIWHRRPSKKAAEHSSFKGYDDGGSFEKKKVLADNYHWYKRRKFLYVLKSPQIYLCGNKYTQ